MTEPFTHTIQGLKAYDSNFDSGTCQLLSTLLWIPIIIKLQYDVWVGPNCWQDIFSFGI
jgi:hypothetical protein